ncbi:flagellar protein FlaG [Thiomicrorhabdus hydrogeniphila]
MSSPVMDTQTVKSVATPAVAVSVKSEQVEASVVSPNMKTPQDNEQAIQDQVEQVNSQLGQLGLGLTFSVDENTQSSVVKVIDKTTDEIIKQYPNEDSLKMMKNIQDYLNSVQESRATTKEGLTGVLFNEII